MTNWIEDCLQALPRKRVAVIGDFFLDRYLMIDSSRDEPSLETGLTAYQVVGQRLYPGAAGNVAKNLAALGVGHVVCFGIIGRDGEGYALTNALSEWGVETDALIPHSSRVTPSYNKPIRDGREANRLDIKNFTQTPPHMEQELLEEIFAEWNELDAIVIGDQVAEDDCGTITHRVREALCERARSSNLPIYTDSRAHIMQYAHVMTKCNDREAVQAFPDMPDIPSRALEWSRRTGRPAFITCGEQGQYVAADGECVLVPARKVEGPVDICGAGDACAAGTVAALCCGRSPVEAAQLGNLVASITIGKLGVTGEASPDEVRALL